MNITMFPGQGSQYKGMGLDLFDRYQDLTDMADAILGYSIKALCLEDQREELSRTQFTQPALYVVNALSYAAKLDEGMAPPDYLLGHSLGEFNALTVAGCIDFETGLRLVQKRGELMSRATDGAMAAVLNASKDEIESRLRDNRLNNVFLANYNTPSQIVLSGAREEIGKAEKLFQEGKMRYYPLATSGAFHSVFMTEAMTQFRDHLKLYTFSEPRIPVIANVTARPHTADAIQARLADHLVSTVRWFESVQYLMALTLTQGQTANFEEVGPGDVLTKLVYTIKAQTPEDALRQIAARDAAGAQAEPAAVEPGVSNSAAAKVAAWNKQYPVGTRAKSTLTDDGPLETRTEAIVLFGHRAAVYMKGFNGYFDLDELSPV